MDASEQELSSVEYGPFSNTNEWQKIDEDINLLSGTRFVNVILKSVRRTGSNNDGYFDGLYLAPIPLLSLDETKIKKDLIIYPNPISDNLRVDWEGVLSGQAHIEIYDILGSKLASLIIHKKENKIDFSKYASGIYFLKINLEGKILTKKVVKK